MSDTAGGRPSNCDLTEEARGSCPFGSLPSSAPIGNVDPLASSDRTHFQGRSAGGELGVTSVQMRKASEAESNNEGKVTREIIHNWADKLSFKYTERKIDELVEKAQKKMTKSGCNELECTQCNESFRSETELRKHYGSDDHLEKVREKSVSKTLGDLKIFADISQIILSRVLGPLQEQTQPNLPLTNQPSLPAATAEVSKVEISAVCYSRAYL